MSLRFRLVIALLFTSLVTIAVVGGVAYWHVARKFTHIQREHATEDFRAGVADYFRTYGSWDAGMQRQSFHEFMGMRHRQGMSGNQIGQGQPEDLPPPPEGQDAGGPGPNSGPDGGPGGGPPDQERRPPPPLFRFTLVDAEGQVLMGPPPNHPGIAVPASAMADAQAVEVNGKTVAYVLADSTLNLSRADEEYLASMQSSLLYGTSAAVALALGLGLLLAQRLSTPLYRLTVAVRAMQGGSLRQHVPEKGGKELAALANAFNRMSDDLAASHEALEQSHQTILAQASEMKELSIRDALTTLYNRRHFDEHARLLYEQSTRHGHPMTVAIADIDFFKRINDNFSHATGDAVLRQVAEIMRAHTRISDVVARYGGEEFVFALPETPLPQAAALCDKLRTLIEQFPWQQIHPDLKVTLSMGLCADLAIGGVESMLQRADTLLYQAKESGRNRVCFA
jgi:diguanylate cyclase (GGDEF)-like protein